MKSPSEHNSPETPMDPRLAVIFKTSAPQVSRGQYLLYLNFRITLWLGWITGAFAFYLLAINLDALIERYDPRSVRTSPLALVVYFTAFQLFFYRITLYRQSSHQMFAFFSGIFSLICLMATVMGVYIFPAIKIPFAPGLLFDIPQSIYLFFFIYISLSNFCFAIFGNRHYF